MKTFYNVLKILAVLAAVAAAVYVAITYGDKIVSWFKDLLCKLRGCCCKTVPAVDAEDAAVEEADFEG